MSRTAACYRTTYLWMHCLKASDCVKALIKNWNHWVKMEKISSPNMRDVKEKLHQLFIMRPLISQLPAISRFLPWNGMSSTVSRCELCDHTKTSCFNIPFIQVVKTFTRNYNFHSIITLIVFLDTERVTWLQANVKYPPEDTFFYPRKELFSIMCCHWGGRWTACKRPVPPVTCRVFRCTWQ